MRFSHKLSLVVLVLLGLSLSVVSTLTISRNFRVSLETTAAGYIDQHLVERYALEADMTRTRRAGNPVSVATLREYSESMTGYVDSSKHWIALYYDAGMDRIYTNLPANLQMGVDTGYLQAAEQGYYLHKGPAGQWLMLIPSSVKSAGAPLWLLSVYDVTGLFVERDRQIRDMFLMQWAVLVVAAIVVGFVASRLTKPMRRLNMTSRKITSGAYDARSDIQSDDEIGELAQSFNRMASAVEGQIDALNLGVQQREDFVSAFTHEVKTPMTAIIGYSDLLRSQQVAPEVQMRAAQFIHRESRRLESLSQKLLVLMGLSAEGADLVPTALNGVFTDAARSVVPNLTGDLQLKIKPADDIHVRADRDLIVDLLRNLVLNALRAEPKDGFVRIGWQREGQHLRISVSDTGKGIAPEEVQRILEPFYMVDKSRARREGSSGVGLALCQKIAQLHGSELAIQSDVGVGTTVSFTLEHVE